MPRPTRKMPKIRFNLDIPLEIKTKLEQLRDITYADSISEVIRKAIAIYLFLWHQHVSGLTIILRSKDGIDEHLGLFPESVISDKILK